MIAAAGILLMTGFANIDGTKPDAVETLRYQIDDRSELSISGTSNVNKFCCSSTEQFEQGEVTFEWTSHKRIKVSDGVLNIASQKLDCGGKQINKDFYATLRAEEFPYIRIVLNYLTFTNEPASEEGWMLAVADTDMIIAGCTNHKYLDVEYRRVDKDRFEVRSTTSVCITDFGIEPPKALFGLIQVDKDVDINMFMFISLHPNA